MSIFGFMTEFLEEFLTDLQNESAAETHARGFLYVHHALTPRLLEAGKIKGINSVLLADGWIRLADIYVLNKAPKRAVDCFRKARVLAPDNWQALQGMVQQFLKMKATNEALELIGQIQQSDGNHFLIKSLHSELEQYTANKIFAEYLPDNQEWTFNELLAAEQFNTVINKVLEGDMTSVMQLKKLACAFGAVGHDANYRQTWEKILKIQPDTMPDACDTFYQPPAFHIF